MKDSHLLTTERLQIRRFTPADAEALYEYLSDPETVRFEPYPPLTREEAEQEAVRRAGDPDFMAVCLRSDGRLIGNIYFSPRDFESWEVGYVFDRRFWKCGYALESVRGVMADAFLRRGAHRIQADCDPQNPNSWRLLERLGMRREGTFRQNVYFFRDEAGEPIWKDSYSYAILRSEFFAEHI